MVAIHSIGGIPEPVGRNSSARNEPVVSASARPARQDDVAFTAEAVEAANRGRLANDALSAEAIRSERIARAKENIEQGVYRIHEVVLQVADRIGQYVD